MGGVAGWDAVVQSDDHDTRVEWADEETSDFGRFGGAGCVPELVADAVTGQPSQQVATAQVNDGSARDV